MNVFWSKIGQALSAAYSTAVPYQLLIMLCCRVKKTSGKPAPYVKLKVEATVKYGTWSLEYYTNITLSSILVPIFHTNNGRTNQQIFVL